MPSVEKAAAKGLSAIGKFSVNLASNFKCLLSDIRLKSLELPTIYHQLMHCERIYSLR